MAIIAEQIVQQIVTTLDAITPTATWKSVDREKRELRPYKSIDDVPAIAVEMGASPASDEDGQHNAGFVDMDLQVYIDIYAKLDTTIEYMSTHLTDIYGEVFLQLMADHTLGGLAENIIPFGFDEPVISVEGDLPVGILTTNWVIKYRHNYLDASL